MIDWLYLLGLVLIDWLIELSRFGCYQEKNPKSCHLLGDYWESIKKDFSKETKPRPSSKVSQVYTFPAKQCRLNSHQFVSLPINLCHFPFVCVTSHPFVSLTKFFFVTSNQYVSLPIRLCQFQATPFPIIPRHFPLVCVTSHQFPSVLVPFHMYASLLSVPTNSLRIITMTLQVSKNHNITDNFF